MLKMIKKFLIKLIHFWQRKTPLCRRLVLFESRGDLADNSYPLFEYLLSINALINMFGLWLMLPNIKTAARLNMFRRVKQALPQFGISQRPSIVFILIIIAV